MARPKTVPEEQRVILKKLGAAHAPFHNVRATLPLQYVTTFLLIANDEHQNVATYAQRAGIGQSLMTRHLHDLGDMNRYREPGLGLIEAYDDPMDRRNRLMCLSPKGRGVVWAICEALK